MSITTEFPGSPSSPRGTGQGSAAASRWSRSAQDTAQTDSATINLTAALQALTLEFFAQSLGKLFEGADNALFEMARHSANNREQSTFLDAMRAVRLGRGRMQQTFLDELRRRFPAHAPGKPVAAAVDDAAAFTLTDSRLIEKSIAIANIATSAEELFKQPLWEIGRRLNTVIHERNAPLSSLALSPISFCEAFLAAVDTQELEVPVALVLYKLFERLVIGDLSALYARLLKLFDQYGIRPEKVSTSAPGANSGTNAWSDHTPSPARSSHTYNPEPVPAPAPQPYGGDGTSSPSMAPSRPAAAFGTAAQAGQPAATGSDRGRNRGLNWRSHRGADRLDPHTLELLRQLAPAGAAPMPSSTYTDQHLANDLLAAALGRIVPGWEPTHARAYVRRTDAIGQMFNGFMADPNLPQALKPQFDNLRFSVIKTALQDVSFFANPAHPVRGLVNELATLAATARAISIDALNRVEDLVAQIRSQFEVAAETALAPKVDPLEHLDIERFLLEQIRANRERRTAIIDKVRRVVADELQLRCAERSIPDNAWPLLKSGWAPVMAAHLLRSGLDSAHWRDGMTLLDCILDELDPRAATHIAADYSRLCGEIYDKLHHAGLPQHRCRELVNAFRAALDEAAQRRREARTAAAPAAMSGAAKPAAAPPSAAAADVLAKASGNAAAPPGSGSGINPGLLLDALIAPGSWFRILDRNSGRNRWMKAVACYPDHDNIAFAEFNGRNSLFIRTQPFLESLAAGDIEPLDLMPMARNLLDRYIRHRRDEASA